MGSIGKYVSYLLVILVSILPGMVMVGSSVNVLLFEPDVKVCGESFSKVLSKEGYELRYVNDIVNDVKYGFGGGIGNAEVHVSKNEFLRELKENGISRVYVVENSGRNRYFKYVFILDGVLVITEDKYDYLDFYILKYDKNRGRYVYVKNIGEICLVSILGIVITVIGIVCLWMIREFGNEVD
jgi:hypothetical protein